MKVLYIAGRWDPRLQDEYSGNDYGAYHAFEKLADIELSLVGPLDFQPNMLERGMMKLYQSLSGKRLMKYPWSYPRRCALEISRAIKQIKPDLVFSKYSAPLADVDIDVPLIYMCDSIVPFAAPLANEFSRPAYQQMERWERKVIQKAVKVITYSQANADLIVSAYGAPPDKVVVFPIPAYVPAELLTDIMVTEQELVEPLRLLFVGKRARLRGVDIAIDAVKQLNREGILAELRIAGMTGNDEEHVRYLGVFNKEEPTKMKAYYENFQWAQLLLHPSRFHTAGMVISEAAAFGLPAITNNVGGLATTVLDGKTGIVLPAGSPASAYCVAIKDLMNHPARYQAFRRKARLRFDAELNWEKAGDKLVEFVRQAVQEP